MDACEFLLERELEEALAILAAVSFEHGSDGGRAGVDVLQVAVRPRQEVGRWLFTCATDERVLSLVGGDAVDADADADADEDEPAAADGEELAAAVLPRRAGGGGLSLQS